jgi:hypothetical protein
MSFLILYNRWENGLLVALRIPCFGDFWVGISSKGKLTKNRNRGETRSRERSTTKLGVYGTDE